MPWRRECCISEAITAAPEPRRSVGFPGNAGSVSDGGVQLRSLWGRWGRWSGRAPSAQERAIDRLRGHRRKVRRREARGLVGARGGAAIAVVEVAVVALLGDAVRRIVVEDAVAADLLAAARRARLGPGVGAVAVLERWIDHAVAAVLELAGRRAAVAGDLGAVVALLGPAGERVHLAVAAGRRRAVEVAGLGRRRAIAELAAIDDAVAAELERAGGG